MVKPVIVFTVGFLQEKYLRAIFRSLIDDQQIEMDSHSTEDSAAVTAGHSYRGIRIGTSAVVLETRSEEGDKIRETYETGCWRVGSFPHPANNGTSHWPSPASEMGLDRRPYPAGVREDPPGPEYGLDSRGYGRRSNNRISTTWPRRSATGWRSNPSTWKPLSEKAGQVRELCTFIEKSSQPKPEPEPVTAENWF